MVGSAAPSRDAVCLADRAVERSRKRLGRGLAGLGAALRRRASGPADLRRAHRRYLALRAQFSRLLGTVDVFSDALTQRAEHGMGVMLRGLDMLAEDGIRARAPLYHPPPLVCYLDDSVPGAGGAIRRAFTRLPGGETNAVGLIKIPRERILGSGLASLLHEVGHQGVASLNLLPDYRAAVADEVHRGKLDPVAGTWWSRKLSEVLPDLWAVAKLGATATLGLFAVLGRTPLVTYHDVSDDPHPVPWLRALTSAAFGSQLMPHGLWAELRGLWLTLYPIDRAPESARALLERLLPTLPQVVDLIARTRPQSLGGASLVEALGGEAVHPAFLLLNLALRISTIRRNANPLPPCQTLATVGLARFLGLVPAEEEHDLLSREVRNWTDRGACRNRHVRESGGLE
jgi:hypothetical protein